MSPEQATGEQNLDGRSDQYALGCVLYEMLAGHPPFTGATMESMVRQHLTLEPPDITDLRPAVPVYVVEALGRVLSKTPADRFDRVAFVLFAEALAPRGPAAEPAPASPAAPVSTRVLVGADRSSRRCGGGRSGRSRRAGPLARAVYVGVGSPRTAIAVLPLENLSAKGPYAYFAGGMHDELLTQLAKVRALTVMGRTSVMAFEGTAMSLQEIADELRVGSMLEGSVQVLGDQLRVIVQLLDPETGGHLWAETYDRTLDDAFAVQSEIAEQVVAAVGAELTEAEAKPFPWHPARNPRSTGCTSRGKSTVCGQRTPKRPLRSPKGSTSERWPWTRPSPLPTLPCPGSIDGCTG